MTQFCTFFGQLGDNLVNQNRLKTPSGGLIVNLVIRFAL